MKSQKDPFFQLENFVPSLHKVLQHAGLKPDAMVMIAVPVKDPTSTRPLSPISMDRRQLCLMANNKPYCWEPESLRSLFRGDRQPPVLGDYPEAYNDCFAIFDLHVLEFSKFHGDRRDSELREIFSALRRRPDGRSTGPLHDYLWQVAALILGSQPLSQAEFEAIMARLERSARRFQTDITSRNFVTQLRPVYEGNLKGPW